MFIVLEGGDYTGKGTQATLLAKETDPYANAQKMAELYIRDREEHVKDLIHPNLKQNVFVIGNRYSLSTCVFQSIQGIPLNDLINRHKERKILTPYVTFILHITPEVAEKRIPHVKANPDKFEANKEFRNKVYEKYLEIAKKAKNQDIENIFGKVEVIDANGAPEEVAAEIASRFNKIYEEWKNY